MTRPSILCFFGSAWCKVRALARMQPSWPRPRKSSQMKAKLVYRGIPWSSASSPLAMLTLVATRRSPRSLCRPARRQIEERLAAPSTYQRIGVDRVQEDDSHSTSFLPTRCEPCLNRPEKPMSRCGARVHAGAVCRADRLPGPRTSVGAIIRERATCTFYSLDGSDAPTRTYWVKIDGEYNTEWAARQPNAAALQLRVVQEQ